MLLVTVFDKITTYSSERKYKTFPFRREEIDNETIRNVET